MTQQIPESSINYILSWLSTVEFALAKIRCQLKVCQAYHFSLKLQKSHFFLKWFELVGIKVCVNGNRPAKSMQPLLETWPMPELVSAIAKFIGFAQFYSHFIHHFEPHIAPLCELTKHKYTDPVALLSTPAAQKALDDMKNAIILDPCHH